MIVGPGPGSPENAEDIGIVKHLWKISDDIMLPIFGVCLGLQSLAIEFGASLKRLHVVKHGQISRIHHDGTDLFQGVGVAWAVRYHSLHVELHDNGEIEQLAWADDGAENGQVVMAVKHRTKPFWAVQYHPESICTAGGGLDVLRNFWRLAQVWLATLTRTVRPFEPEIIQLVGPSWPHLRPHSPPSSPRGPIISTVATSVIDLPRMSVSTICELLGARNEASPFVVLESAAQPGRFSIVGSLTAGSPRITYVAGEAHVRLTRGSKSTLESLGSHDIWSWIASFVRCRKIGGGAPEIPFWGGLVGYLGYEIGVNTIGVHLPSRGCVNSAERRPPDVNLAFVERSVVKDMLTGKAYVQTIKANDEAWLRDTVAKLRSQSDSCSAKASNTIAGPIFLDAPRVTLPDKALYKSRIALAKEHLFAGDSYELCLTALTRIRALSQKRCSGSSTSWDLYKLLQHRNPAPHAGYLRLHPTTLVSSSPERFLSFSRPSSTLCQLRPIKGTVRKGPGITREVAEQALKGSAKEVAENLMIVDLIRHDLHGVVGDDVTVKQFCSVEEYETVWQLVSVIEGRLSEGADGPDLDSEGELGWEVLRRSLPPGTCFAGAISRISELLSNPIPAPIGSMTGAPKKRSVEILQTLEDNERNIYSGVFGYWCVSGGGDWSVVIRSCFKHDDRDDHHDHSTPRGDEDDKDAFKYAQDVEEEEWTIGAGGAITALSDEDAEWDEMITKLQSVLQTFEEAGQGV